MLFRPHLPPGSITGLVGLYMAGPILEGHGASLENGRAYLRAIRICLGATRASLVLLCWLSCTRPQVEDAALQP